uniref:TACC_C domain-containing protein n=1 Tax=Angiostrongylus cantonensis TaxID=6313 RepID=A0A0K0CZQ9_ANGCA
MDDIVWIREEPPASDNGNHSAANDNTIVAERFSTTLSPQISSTSAVNCTDQFAQKQFSEPANESQRLNEEKRVSFNIPPPFTNITGTSNAEPPFKRQEGVQYEASSIPNSNQEGFNITLSYLSASESKSSDNSIKKLPEHLDQNSPKELEEEAPANQTSHEASTLPSQENLMQSNEQRGFIITVSYPGDSEKKSTDNSSEKQPQHPDQNPPKELEKEALVNGTSSPASTLPAVVSSIKQKLDNKSREDTKQNNGQKGFNIVISYPGDSEKKSTDNSSEKQPQQPDQNPLKELEKEALVNEAPYPGSTSLTADSSIQKQPDDKAPETTKRSNEQGNINNEVSLSNDAFSSDPVHINVDVFGPMITTPPNSIGVNRPTSSFDSTQVKVEKFEPWTTNVPATTGLSALEINAEPAKEQEESKTAQAKLIEDSTGISNRNDIDKNDDGFDISEYERKLYKTTKETKDLVNRLCDTSQKLDQNTRSIANNVAVQRKCLFEDVYKTIEDIEQLPPPPELPTGGYEDLCPESLRSAKTAKTENQAYHFTFRQCAECALVVLKI